MNVGDKAPDFLGLNEKGEEIRLSNYKGKKVVLYFYPKDMTSGCTAQACNLRDNYEALQNAGYEIIGASIQDAKSHQKFIEKNSRHSPSLPIRNRNWFRNSEYGAKRACTAENIWEHSVLRSLSMKKA